MCVWAYDDMYRPRDKGDIFRVPGWPLLIVDQKHSWINGEGGGHIRRGVRTPPLCG